jgi:hypothetical protein
MIDGAEVLWQTPWPQITASAVMILARSVAAWVSRRWRGRTPEKWIEREWPGHVLPAESRIEG